MVTGSEEISSVSSKAETSSLSIKELFLSSPYFSASSISSFLIKVLSRPFELMIFSSSNCSPSSSCCSVLIFSSSSLANCLNLISRIESTCTELSLYFFWRTFLGSSSVLMILITSSIFR